MRRIKNIILCTLVLFSLTPVFADEDFSFTYETQFGMKNGEIDELVLRKYSGKYIPLSELFWDVSNIFYVGNSFKMDFAKHIHLDLNYKIGFPKQSGIMQDCDWLDFSDVNNLTNYSCHNNFLNNYNDLSFSMGWNFFFAEKCSITPAFNFEFETYSFTASDGCSKYCDLDTNTWTYDTYQGDVITYRQEFSTWKLGAILQIGAIPFIDIGLQTFITPDFKMDGYDYHILRDIKWYDKMEKGFLVNADANINFRLNHFSFGLFSGIQFVPLAGGMTYQKYGTMWLPTFSLGGGKRLIWDIGLNFRFVF